MKQGFRTRQVHLDFHTSEAIAHVGRQFNSKQFQSALQAGHVDSITVFGKCHHGWCYYPTTVGSMHPHLGFDLTGAQIEAAHAIGVKAPVYITVGWSAHDAEQHPEWLVCKKDGVTTLRTDSGEGAPEEPRPHISWQFLCVGGGYGQRVFEITREICERYRELDGLFFDINFREDACYCASCRAGMQGAGLDPENEADAKRYAATTWRTFCLGCREILVARHPEASLFFNGGAEYHSPQNHDIPTHFELEDLPTSWGGYDKMPLRGRYFSQKGKPFLGMTGKFHTNWGEFGGFKAPEALRHECAAMLANGARCSVGDQLHPEGRMDEETYRLIGHAYEYIERIEEYCFDTTETTRLGVFLAGKDDGASNEGMVKMLMEAQLDFDVVGPEDDLRRFDAVILPDAVVLDDAHAGRLREFAANGGGIVLSGTSGLDTCGGHFLLDIGAAYQGPARFENDFGVVAPALGEGLITTPVLFYEPALRLRVTDGEILAGIHEPYFNRTFGRYCSHRNTPYRPEPADHPAAVRKGSIIHLAHPVCRLYSTIGMKFYRDYFLRALRLVYRDPVMAVDMPSCGRARLVCQPAKNRFVLHLMYAPPLTRGCAQVLDDMPELRDIRVRLRLDRRPARARMMPQDMEIAIAHDDGAMVLTVSSVKNHQLVVIEYE